ncbi:conserved hypothetical protein [Planktothrix sp. PCC 11201]|uniref:DUF262 domain-containing protein n=1 Tax=Planktothrix sp. PCC 11201 TaxID=1729650 RepID=UPI000917F048|nr:DUF262 domain-containing protein [Planktothrix sp. PCC 11201]SKB13710.1 conserved hypothetical protein [Planktothrix sp. PCC 11201]
MDLNPAYTPVGTLFDNKPMFFIPKYQRAYAWEGESIKDFIKDLKNCFVKRKSQSPINHFLGGILSVEYPVAGVVRQHEYEIIDGQQRAATFTLLMACLVTMYKELLNQAKNSQDATNEEILQSRIKDLSKRFIEFDQEVQRTITKVEVLKLSKPDQNFYRNLIREKKPSVSRDSHRKLLEAYNSISEAVKEMIDKSNLVTKMDDLEVIQNVIDSDFTVLHMVTKAKEDAFRLFQVINDRGTSLTEGDLLRAKTLEILENFSTEQNSVEDLWNEILSDPPNKTANYLNWIYESNHGRRASQNALFDNFIDAFFPEHKSPNLTVDDANNIYIKVKDINENIIKCRKLENGEWLYKNQQPITGWDKNRLNLLLKELDHTLCIPLLLAASTLDHQKFSQVVQIIEKAFFRYKIICNQHATPLQTIYREEANSIRTNPTQYKLTSLKGKLRTLINKRASDDVFKANLELLHYKETGGGSNKPLKYFLLTAEYYYQWFKQGATGEPVCTDKTRVYDFASTSIEHIYSQNADSSVFDSTLEPVKHSLGNLTILDPALNATGNNDSFVTKKLVYQGSSVFLTKEEVGTKTAWDLNEINSYKQQLINIGMKIFQI